jgi:ribulose kinase
MELYADVSGRTVLESTAQDPTLLGVAIVAATAAGLYADLSSACSGMFQPCVHLRPDPEAKERLERDYRVQLAMQRHRAELLALATG